MIKDLIFICITASCFIYCSYLTTRYYNIRKNLINILKHDFKVIALSQLRGLELLEHEAPNELIAEIKKSCQFSLDMISSLLNIYSKKNKKSFKFFNITSALINCFEFLNEAADEKEITFYHNFDDNIQIYAEEYELTKVLKTLITTAILHANKKSNIACLVKTTGSETKISIVYEQDFSKNSKNFSTVGYGIKMDFCKNTIKTHGGKFFVTKHDKKLNSFTFILPQKKVLYSGKSIVTS